MRHLLIAFAALLGLLGLSVAVAFLPLGAFGWVAGMAIALLKATIVLFAFMEFRGSAWEARAAGLAGGVWLALLFCLIFADYLYR